MSKEIIEYSKELVKDINMRTYNFAEKQVFSTKKINYDNLIKQD